MKHLKSLQLFEKVSLLKNPSFWQDIDKVLKEMIHADNFHAFWDLKNKYPEFVELKETIQDKIIVPLHNRNIVKKRISLEEKILMFIMEMAGYGRSKALTESFAKYPDFKTWFENANLKIYRGVPARKIYNDGEWVVDNNSERNLELQKEGMIVLEKSFKSFTLDLKTAIKFTQSDWAGKGWINEKERNGFVFEGHIKPCDIHIFQNEGHEEECVIKGLYQCDKVYKVSLGKIKT